MCCICGWDESLGAPTCVVSVVGMKASELPHVLYLWLG